MKKSEFSEPPHIHLLAERYGNFSQNTSIFLVSALSLPNCKLLVSCLTSMQLQYTHRLRYDIKNNMTLFYFLYRYVKYQQRDVGIRRPLKLYFFFYISLLF